MPVSSTGPITVRNIMLNWRASVSVALPHTGHFRPASSRCATSPPAVCLGVLPEPLLDQVIGAEAALAGPAIDERVVETLDVTRRLPNARVHQDASVDPDDVAPPMDEGPPPEVLDVAFSSRRAVHSPRCWPDRRRCPSRGKRTRAACRARRSCPW